MLMRNAAAGLTREFRSVISKLETLRFGFLAVLLR